MTILKIDSFTGMIPRLPSDRLPDGAADLAINCDFRYGELRSLKGPGVVKATASAVRSLFTDDGLRGFVWTQPTRAVLAPTIDDTFERLYYNTSGQGLRVAQMSGAQSLGAGTPAAPQTSWKVGVARPSEEAEVELLPTIAWDQDLDATPRLTALIAVAGGTAREVEVTVVSTPLLWRQYVVDLDEPVELEEEGPDELTPDGNGWITLPEAAIFYFDGEYGDGARAPASTVIPAGWSMRPAGTENQGFLFNNVGGSWEYIEAGISGIQYQGRLWTSFQDFYDYYTGTGNVTPPKDAPTQPGSDEEKIEKEIKFRFEVVGSEAKNSGNILYASTNTKVTPVEGVPGRYTVDIEYLASEARTVSYVITFENTWGEESAPSEPYVVDVLPWQDVRFAQTYTPLVGGVAIAGLNLYRTYGATAAYIKANTEPRTEQDNEGRWLVKDSTRKPNTTIALQSVEWDAPPADLENLTYAGNGILVGSAGKDLRMSEPYRPHAWPYFMTFPHKIVGIVEVEGGLLVTTRSQPYFVFGTHPEQMSQQRLNADQAGASSRAMAKLEGRAIYASNDGLVSVAGGQASIESSQQLFTRDDWRQRFADAIDNIVLGAWDGMLLGAIDPTLPDSTGVDENFILRLDEAPGFSRMSLPAGVGAPLGFAVAEKTDRFYVCGANGFAPFGEGDDMEFDWFSKVYVFPRPVFFAAGVAQYNTIDGITLRLTSIDNLEDSGPIDLPWGSDRRAFRIRSMAPSKRWSVSLKGKGSVMSVEFGASFAELQNG